MKLRSETWLVDTGPCVAYFDRKDPAHETVAGRLEELGRQLPATGAVVTEVTPGEALGWPRWRHFST